MAYNLFYDNVSSAIRLNKVSNGIFILGRMVKTTKFLVV